MKQVMSNTSRVHEAERAVNLAYERWQAEKTLEAKVAYEAAWSMWIELMMSRTPLHNP